MSKEMFEIYKKKGKEADACFAVGLSGSGHVSALFPYVPIDSTF